MDSKCWWNRDFEVSSRNWEDEEIEEEDEINGKSESTIFFAVITFVIFSFPFVLSHLHLFN
jgi:hypothetical protein